MKIGLLYYSETGNTEKIAKALFSVCGEKTELASIPQVSKEKFGDYDLIILGMPIFGDNMPEPVKNFLNENDLKEKRIALFYTHAAPMNHSCPQTFLTLMQNYFREKKAFFVGSWHCRGENKNLEVLAWLKKNSPDVYELAVTAKGKPDGNDLENAKHWLKEILKPQVS
jgi:flavodoxin